MASDPMFWRVVGASGLDAAGLDMEPARCLTLIDDDDVDDIAAAFAQVVASKNFLEIRGILVYEAA